MMMMFENDYDDDSGCVVDGDDKSEDDGDDNGDD